MPQQKKKKVLFFLPPTVGGAERMTVIIARMLPLEEFEVKFVVVGKSKGDIAAFIPEDYPVRLLRMRSIWLGGTLRIWKVVREEKPDITFSSLLYLNARLILASKLCGRKVIVRNNIDLSRTTHKANLPLVRFTYRWADKVIAQQDEMRSEILSFTGLPEEKVVTLHNPIDTDYIDLCTKAENPFPPEAQGQYKYLWVARFSPRKGQDLLVEAFEKVHRKNYNTHLYLVGTHDDNDIYLKQIFHLIQSRGIGDFVHLICYDKNPYRWMKHADCYVLPSRLEGLPNTLIDAMYLGKPVVATRCVPVIDRIVKDGENGIVVEPDNAEALAQGMLKAPLLKNLGMTYQPATSKDFVSLFKSI